MVDKLSADGTSSVEIHSGSSDPSGKAFWSVTCFWLDESSVWADSKGAVREEFSGPSIVDCLKDAMATRGFVEDPPAEEDRAEQRMFPAATAIVRVMTHLWNVRSSMMKAVGTGMLPKEYVEAQRLEIRRAMALAEQALGPILEGLAGYCWSELPGDVQGACREAGIDNPHPWPFRKRPLDPEKLDRYAESVGKALMCVAEGIDRQHFAPVQQGLIYDSAGRIVDPARIGWGENMGFADLVALRDRLVTEVGSTLEIPETLWISAARFDWMLHRGLIDEAGLFTEAGRSYVPAEVKRVRRLSR